MVGPPYYTIPLKRGQEGALKVENCCLSTVSGAYKATPGRSLQAKVSITPLPLYMDGRQAKHCLGAAESEIDRVIGEGILKVR
jgi:hypothetical protein